jgi:type I restriction enzyme, S subunit
MMLADGVARKVHEAGIAREGDILIACSAAGCLGRVARYVDSGKMCSTDTHVAIARPDSDVIEPDYLYAYLRGAQGQVQLRSRERGDWQREKISFRRTELNLADLRKVPVPVPPRSKQIAIVAAIESLRAKIDGIRRLQSDTSAEIDAMLPAILDQAFRGEL